MLDGGAGFTTYTWSTGANSRYIWIKNNSKINLTVTNSLAACGKDSTVVIFVKGIQQKDTSICAGSNFKLSIPSSTIPSNGLVGYWPFTGNANDASGNGNNGTVNGSQLTNDSFGNLNSAYSFNTNSHIYVPFSSSLNTIQSGLTMSSWIYMDGGTGSGTPPRILELRGGYGGGGNAGFVMLSQGNSNTTRTFEVRWYNNNGNTNISVYPTFPVSALSWHHVAFSCDGLTGIGKFYMDGVLLNTNASQANQGLISSCNYNNNGLFIGAEPNLLGKWGGKIDELVLHNRALSAIEIQALYSGIGGNANTKVTWSTTDTTNSISVAPSISTTYRCTQRIGSFTMTDSVRVTVIALPIINSLPDTTIAFKQDSFSLNAGVGYSKYVWSRGDTTQSIWVKTPGMNKVTVFNSSGCSNSDSTNVIFVKGIQQKDTSICAGSNFKLSIPSSTIPSNGLVGYWPFSGNANDASGNGNNGTVNGATLTTDRNGNASSAYSFDGVNDYIIGLSNSFPTNQRTVSVWFFSNNIGIGNLGRVVLGYGGNTCGQSWNMHLDNPGSPLGFDSYEVNTHCNVFYVTSSYGSLIPNGNWHNWVVSTNPNGTYFYLDGNLIQSSNQFINNTVVANKNFVFGTFTNPNGIGASINDPNNTVWNGTLDDIGIWNRALTSFEIQALYNNGGNVTKKLWSTNDTTSSINVTPTTNTTYRCTQRIGSFTMTDSIRVTVRNLPSKTINCNKKGLCKNDTISINASTGYVYNWYKNNNIIAGTNNTLKANTIGNYKAKLTDSTGCSTMSDSVILFNAPLPKVKISLPDTALCLNGNVYKYTDSTTLDSGSFNRIWSFGNGNTSILSTSNQSYTSAGIYTAKLKVTTNYGCADSTIKNITVKPNPIAGVMLGQVINLISSTPYIYTVAQQINHLYNWVVTNGIVVLGQSTNAATVQWISNGNGYIKLELTNPQGCIDTTALATKIGNVGMNETSTINNLSLYPNPNHGSFTVGFTLKESSTTKLELVNTLGQQVWLSNMQLQNGEQQIPINLSLSAGVYVLKITTSTGEITKQVLVK